MSTTSENGLAGVPDQSPEFDPHAELGNAPKPPKGRGRVPKNTRDEIFAIYKWIGANGEGLMRERRPYRDAAAQCGASLGIHVALAAFRTAMKANGVYWTPIRVYKKVVKTVTPALDAAPRVTALEEMVLKLGVTVEEQGQTLRRLHDSNRQLTAEVAHLRGIVSRLCSHTGVKAGPLVPPSAKSIPLVNKPPAM